METRSTEFMVIRPLEGDDLGVCKTENYRLVQCCEGHVVFSYTWQGEAINMHMAADRQGVKHLKRAFNHFCQWLFDNYKPSMILGGVNKASVARMVERCGCIHIANSDELKIYMRLKQWAE